jgi:hypothetical protein
MNNDDIIMNYDDIIMNHERAPLVCPPRGVK